MTMALCGMACLIMTMLAAFYCLSALSKHAGWRRLALLAMPLGQLVFTLSVLWIATSNGMSIVYPIGACAAHTLGCIGICALVWGIGQTQSVAVNRERLRVAEESARAASEYKALLAANAAQMRELCEGFAAELKALETAMEEREGTARLDGLASNQKLDDLNFTLLEGALEKLEKTTRTHYCANATANAILALKARTCADAGIEFTFTGFVPQELATDDLELCSVFSNLLDNAINAAGNHANNAPASFVRISCTAKGVYLIIKVVNSCSLEIETSVTAKRRPKYADPSREHGWGLEIVNDICSKRGGSFALEHTSPTEITATAILKNC